MNTTIIWHCIYVCKKDPFVKFKYRIFIFLAFLHLFNIWGASKHGRSLGRRSDSERPWEHLPLWIIICLLALLPQPWLTFRVTYATLKTTGDQGPHSPIEIKMLTEGPGILQVKYPPDDFWATPRASNHWYRLGTSFKDGVKSVPLLDPASSHSGNVCQINEWSFSSYFSDHGFLISLGDSSCQALTWLCFPITWEAC